MDESKCKCTFVQRMVGDGCDECQGKTTCTPNERAFLDELKELYEWNDHLGFPHLQRKKITKFSNIYQQDFTKSNLKDLVNGKAN